jgi:hypothetical protein
MSLLKSTRSEAGNQGGPIAQATASDSVNARPHGGTRVQRCSSLKRELAVRQQCTCTVCASESGEQSARKHGEAALSRYRMRVISKCP